MVKDHLHADVGTLGLLYAIFPIGYILGGIWVGRSARIRHRAWITYGGVIVAGLMLLTFGLPIPVIVIALAALANGAATFASGILAPAQAPPPPFWQRRSVRT